MSVLCSLFLHFVEVLEAAGAHQHEGKEDEVVGGVNEGAGGEGAGGEAGEAEDEADAVEERERSEGVGDLFGMHGGEGKAGEQRGDDHGGERKLRMAVGAKRTDTRTSAQGVVPLVEPGESQAADNGDESKKPGTTQLCDDVRISVRRKPQEPNWRRRSLKTRAGRDHRRSLATYSPSQSHGGAKNGKKEATEGHLFKEGRDGDAEAEEQPGGGAVGEHFVDGRVVGAGEDEFVDHGEDEAEAAAPKSQPR
jgi:hypothetical protein